MYTCLPVYLLYDLRDHVELMELRHDVNTVRPGLDPFDQLNRQLHTDLRSVFARGLDAPARLLGDEDAGYFIV